MVRVFDCAARKDWSISMAGYAEDGVVAKIGGGHVAKFDRITTDPAQMGGLPCIRGLRITVAAVVDMLAEDMTVDTIIENYPDPPLASRWAINAGKVNSEDR